MEIEERATPERPLVSVILSFRNEEEVIPELIDRLQKTLRPLEIDYELIFVNDYSMDNSLDILLEKAKEDSRIKTINMSRRFGGSQCVSAGMEYSSGDAVIYMDTDLQDPPELIPTLIEKWREGADVVNTTRTKRKGESFFKMWLTRRAYRAINLMADIDIPENTGDFKLLSRRAVNSLLKLKENDPFMRGLVRWVGYNQVQVCYEREPRFAGETHYSLFRSINPAKEFLRGIISFSAAPLYMSLIIGFLVSMGAFGYLIYVLVSRIFWGMHLPGWSAIMTTMLFLGGIILFTIGILGIYVGRIHAEIRNRPRFIVDNVIDFTDNPLRRSPDGDAQQKP